MAGVELATAYVSLVVEGSKVAPGVRSALGAADGEASRAGDKAGRSFTSRFGGALKVGGALAGAFAVTKGVQFLGDAIGEASDLGESLNALNVTYADNAKQISALGKDAAESLGLSRVEFNGLAVQFSAFASTIAGKGGDVVGTIDDLTTRGADFASVMNIEVNEALGLFQSGLAGETEPLRKFGIDLSAAAVQAHAYKIGLAEAGDELTEQQKVQARYSLLLEQTSKTQGDFANTSDSLANSQRRLGAQWDNLKAQLGEELLPVIQDVTNWFANEAVPATSDFIREFQKGKGTGGEVREVVEDIWHATEKAAGFAADFVGWFKDMPDWAQVALGGGAAGLMVGSKLGLGKVLGNPLSRNSGGLLGGVAAGGVQKVFETNPAALGGGPGGGKPGVPGGGTTPFFATAGAGGLAAFFGPALGAALGGILIPALLKGEDERGAKFSQSSTSTGSASGSSMALTPGMSEDLFDFGAADTARIAMHKLLESVAATMTGFSNLKAVVGGYDDEIAQMVRRHPEQGLDKLREMSKLTGASVGELRDVLPKTSDEITKSGVVAKHASVDVKDWALEILGARGEVDKVDGKKPKVTFAFPGLLPGIDDTVLLGRRTDEVGRKRPRVPFAFPDLPFGVDKVWELNRGIDQLPPRKDIYITTHYNKTYGGQAGGGGHYKDPEARAHGGPVKAGHEYIVGERRPERFIAPMNGRIDPYPETRSMRSAAGGRNLSDADLRRLVDMLAPRMEGALYRGSAEKRGRLTAGRKVSA